jgi:deoxyribodipyrimidine photo-lyase
MVNNTTFAPSQKALQDRIEAVEVHPYETTRNWITGKVTRLSPYITHGYVNMPTVINTLRLKKGLNKEHKLYAELGWREFFQHVWSHLNDDIFNNIRPSLPNISYSSIIPIDVLEARTGIAAIDLAITELYLNGYVHNHARMWLASYLIHFRKISWKVGADWMYSHLLDGDLASNHLSWQWVGATFSNKPYIFNAENIAKYSPKNWHCSGSPLDQSYEALEKIARSPSTLAMTSNQVLIGEQIPETLKSPPQTLLQELGIEPATQFPTNISGSINLTHPWDLSEQANLGYRIGIIYLQFHAEHTWSILRWKFVLTRMKELCDAIWIGHDANEILSRLSQLQKSVRIQDTNHPFYKDLIKQMNESLPMDIHSRETYFQNPKILCPSFSKYWQQVSGKASFPLP